MQKRKKSQNDHAQKIKKKRNLKKKLLKIHFMRKHMNRSRLIKKIKNKHRNGMNRMNKK